MKKKNIENKPSGLSDSPDVLAFEKVKSRHMTKFVNVRKTSSYCGLSDVAPLFIGYENCLPGHSFGPFARSSYLIHYVTDGKGVFSSKGKKYKVGKGEAFIIVPDEITTYTADKTSPWSYVWIAFNGNLAQELNKLESPIVKLKEDCFKEIKSIVESAGSVSQEYVASIAFKIFDEIFLQKSQNENVALQIVNYVETQYMTDISVDGIAAAVGFDRRYVGRLFKKVTGVSVQEYIIKTRIERAQELLKMGYKVRDAAVMSGYHDQFNFTKMFTKRVGTSPREYAKRFK